MKNIFNLTFLFFIVVPTYGTHHRTSSTYLAPVSHLHSNVPTDKSTSTHFALHAALAKAVENEPREVILNEIAVAAHTKEEILGTELIRILSEREDLSLIEINTVLALLPKVITSYTVATELYRIFTDRYRKTLIQLVLDEFVENVSPDQQKNMFKIYLLSFHEKSSERLDQLKSAKLLSDSEQKVLARIEERFRALKDEMDDFKIRLNQALEQADSQEILLDIQPLLLGYPGILYLYQTLEDLLSQSQSLTPEEQLERAIQYFNLAYDVSLEILFEEDTPEDKIPKSFGTETPATLYSKREIPELLQKLVLVDQWFSVLPRGLILTSLSLQKIVIVKWIRAYYQHSEEVKSNHIVLPLDTTYAQHTFYHEFGHSLHGPSDDFASFVEIERLHGVVLKNQEFFESIDKKLLEAFDKKEFSLSEIGLLVWRVFEALYKKRLQEWKEFNREKLGILDLDVPEKPSREEAIEEHYGVKADRGAESSISLVYMFEIPPEDSSVYEGDFVRKSPKEMIAEYTQLYLLNPEALKRLDPVGFDLFNFFLGEAHSEPRTKTPVTEADLKPYLHLEALQTQKNGKGGVGRLWDILKGSRFWPFSTSRTIEIAL